MPAAPTDDARTRALDATSTEPWGPARSLLDAVRADASSPAACPDVLHVLLNALRAPPAQWRRTLKALITLSHCIRIPEVTRFARAQRSLIVSLARFEHVDAYGLDRGAAVRTEAAALAELLQLRIPSASSAPSSSQPRSSHATSSTPSSSSTRPPPPPKWAWNFSPDNLFASADSTSYYDKNTPASDATHLAHLIHRVDASPGDENIWLNIYKILFLIHTDLPTSSSDDIRHWRQHAHLFARLASGPSSSISHRGHAPLPAVAADVRRLAGDITALFESRRSSDIRRRARMI